ncbi:hypothetical protein MLD38_033175 [Melastoma candidum]|uniref:Uncharacterized protein n=1 Tax=Melastoma candidum TaxID=119954 RepID=A0ACB9M6G7_9MYRT|nr:hypothetical protein MLD38_033175 [Melastoma candidum]
MGDEAANAMNLDLNLGPVSEQGSDRVAAEAMDLDGWMDGRVVRVREANRLRARQRGRWRHLIIPPHVQSISMDWNQLVINSGNPVAVQAGEGSVAPRENVDEGRKVLDNCGSGFAMDSLSEEKKDDVDKISDEDGGFFDCNICLDMARDPVVTCCGHLFCWPCLYRWIHIHSDVKECPVCKGEVTIKNLTPIYGRGNSVSNPPEEDLSIKIPTRPPARRAESFRQVVQRTSLHFPMEDIIRQLNNSSDLAPASNQPPEPTDARDLAARNGPALNRLLTSRGLRRDRNLAMATDDALNNAQIDGGSTERWDARHIHSLLLRRSQSHRNPPVLPLHVSAFSAAERVVGPPRRRGPMQGRNDGQPPPVDDRNSFSSIAAVIISDSQLDTAVEIDSMGSLSTSTSRQGNDAARASDVDGSDARAPRRRRME